MCCSLLLFLAHGVVLQRSLSCVPMAYTRPSLSCSINYIVLLLQLFEFQRCIFEYREITAQRNERDMADSKEIFTYTAPWPVYGLSWSSRPSTFRLALSSFQQDFANKLQVIQVFPGSEAFTSVVEADHPFPVTKLKWSPYKVCMYCHALAE